jgi:hypothetical protein
VKQNSVSLKGTTEPPYVTQDPATGWLTLTGAQAGGGYYFPEAGFPYHNTGIYTWNFESSNYTYTAGSLRCRMRNIVYGSCANTQFFYTWNPNDNGSLSISGTGGTGATPADYSTWATSGQIRSAQVRLSGTTDTVVEYYINGVMVYSYTRTGESPNSYNMNMDFMVTTADGCPNYEVILKSMTWAPLE